MRYIFSMAHAHEPKIGDRVLAEDRQYAIHSLYVMLGESRFNANAVDRAREPEEISGLTAELAWDARQKAWIWTAA